MATQEEINSFTQFAVELLSNGGSALSMDDLYELWRSQNPTREELADSVAAVNAALDDMKAGDIGIPADEHLTRLRTKFNIGE